jgi:hypothetical protein
MVDEELLLQAKDEALTQFVDSYVEDLKANIKSIEEFYEEQEEKEMIQLNYEACKKHFEKTEKENNDPFKKPDNKKPVHPYGRDPPEHWEKIYYSKAILSQLNPCEHCNEDPCVMDQYEKEFDDFSDSLIGNRQSQNERRYASYRFMVRLIHGVLPKGKRRKLPLCVTREIHDNFPERDGNYKGFQPSKMI